MQESGLFFKKPWDDFGSKAATRIFIAMLEMVYLRSQKIYERIKII